MLVVKTKVINSNFIRSFNWNKHTYITNVGIPQIPVNDPLIMQEEFNFHYNKNESNRRQNI